MITLAPTTELEAVNEMLRRVGETAVSSLDGTGLADVETAKATLRDVVRRVQLKGWHWNTDRGRVLARDSMTAEIALPSNCITVDTTEEDTEIDVVQRGGRLYDTRNHRYTFEKNVKVNLTTLVPFDEMPEVARQYCVVKASRDFSAGFVGSDRITQFNDADERRLWAEVRRQESRVAGRNVLANASINYVIRGR